MKTMFNLLVLFGFLFTAACQSDKISTEKAATPTSTSAIYPTQISDDNTGIDMTDPTENPQAKIMIHLPRKVWQKNSKSAQIRSTLHRSRP